MARLPFLLLVHAMLAVSLSGYAPALPATGADVDPESLAAAFAAAGFERDEAGRYIRCQEDPPTMSYQPGRAEVVDLNGDGQPEIWITEDSVFCYGNTGSAFVLLTRDSNGWRKLLDQTGMPLVLDARHAGWPDIEVGGPGFGKFPVFRREGQGYSLLP